MRNRIQKYGVSENRGSGRNLDLEGLRQTSVQLFKLFFFSTNYLLMASEYVGCFQECLTGL